MSDSSASSSQSSSSKTNKEVSSQVGSPYARYVLGVLVVVYIFNFIDRQILSILAEDIKADLGISDADIGFLYGTAFAIFYAVFGIPLGRLADTWTRKSLISTGLLFWSVMTALSGTARSFASLATFRIGVGGNTAWKGTQNGATLQATTSGRWSVVDPHGLLLHEHVGQSIGCDLSCK